MKEFIINKLKDNNEMLFKIAKTTGDNVSFNSIIESNNTIIRKLSNYEESI